MKSTVNMNKVREMEERRMSVFFDNKSHNNIKIKTKKKKIMKGEIFLDKFRLKNFLIPENLMSKGKKRFSLFLEGRFNNYDDYRKINFDEFNGIILTNEEWDILSNIPENEEIVKQVSFGFKRPQKPKIKTDVKPTKPIKKPKKVDVAAIKAKWKKKGAIMD
jgi:hypothetical protein